jgi:hypothetical protein
MEVAIMARSKTLPAVTLSRNALAVVTEMVIETKAAKFKRLANIRAGEALLAINRLGNLGTPAYEYTDAQIAHVAKVLRGALDEAVGRLKLKGGRRRDIDPIL